VRPHCQCMTNFTELVSVSGNPAAPFTDRLRPAVAAYLARFKGSSREHTESDLRSYLAWCAEHGLDPLAAQRPHLELYIRWMQEIRRLKPSTVSRRFSVAAGFYRTCVLDGILEHSPAEHVRRPAVPTESPTLGFTHLQFEALLAADRQSPHPSDFALVAMLGLLGLRIFEATSADIADLGEEHGHRVLRVCGKGTKIVLVPLPPAVGRAIDRATGNRSRGPILLNSRGARMDRHAATRRLRRLAESAGINAAKAHPHILRHTFVTTMLDAGVDLRDVQIAARHADPRTTMHQVGPARTSTGTPTTSSPPTWPPAPDPACVSRSQARGRHTALPKSGRCMPVYSYIYQYDANGRGNRQFSTAIQIVDAPTMRFLPMGSFISTSSMTCQFCTVDTVDATDHDWAALVTYCRSFICPARSSLTRRRTCSIWIEVLQADTADDVVELRPGQGSAPKWSSGGQA
jgi:integrase/recombinase XerD